MVDSLSYIYTYLLINIHSNNFTVFIVTLFYMLFQWGLRLLILTYANQEKYAVPQLYMSGQNVFFQTCEITFTRYLLSDVILSCIINIYHYCANLDQQRPSVHDLAHVHDDTATVVKFV